MSVNRSKIDWKQYKRSVMHYDKYSLQPSFTIDSMWIVIIAFILLHYIGRWLEYKLGFFTVLPMVIMAMLVHAKSAIYKAYFKPIVAVKEYKSLVPFNTLLEKPWVENKKQEFRIIRVLYTKFIFLYFSITLVSLTFFYQIYNSLSELDVISDFYFVNLFLGLYFINSAYDTGFDYINSCLSHK